MICLHGWNGDGGVFRSPAYRRLLRGCRVYAPDLPGFGESEGLEEYDFESLTRILDGFADEMGLRGFGLLGQCMGGIIALDYAIRHRARVCRLVLVETMIYFPVWMNLLTTDFIGSGVLQHVLKRKAFLRALSIGGAFRKLNISRRLLKMFQKVDTACSVKYIRLMKDYSKHDHLIRAKELGDTPVILITASSTFKQVRKTAQDLERALDNARVINISGKNHFIFMDQSKCDGEEKKLVI